MANSRETFTVRGESSDELQGVEDAVGDLEGVQDVQVDPGNDEVTVRYGEELVSGEAIKDAVRDQGYEVD